MGEGALVWAVSTEEMCSVHTSVMTNVHGLRADMDGVTGVIRELTNVILHSHRRPTATPAPCHNTDIEAPQRPEPPLTIRIPPRPTGTVTLVAPSESSSIPHFSPSRQSSDMVGIAPPSFHAPENRLAALAGSQSELTSTVGLGNRTSNSGRHPPAPRQHGKTGTHRHASNSLPKAGLFKKASLEWCRGNSKIWENPVRENTTHYTVGYTCKVVLSSYLALGCERTCYCQLKAGRIYTYGLFVHVSMRM
jgi:hypothetical protein